MSRPDKQYRELLDRWRKEWPTALEKWSAYTLLREPTFFASDLEAKNSDMAGQIAAIRLTDQSVMVNAAQIVKFGLEKDALAILAHEIGHHVYVPGNLSDNGRMIAAIMRSLTGMPVDTLHLVSNLYGDLLINDRLQRRADVDVVSVYRKINDAIGDNERSNVWNLYTRTYEHLWRLAPETITPPGIGEEMDQDAILLARIIRNYADEWLRGARKFATVVHMYLLLDQSKGLQQTFNQYGLQDTKKVNQPQDGQQSGNYIPDGLTSIDDSEIEDGELYEGELDGAADNSTSAKKIVDNPSEQDSLESKGQARQPLQYGQLLKSLGLDLEAHEVTSRYYRERALPHLIPFPTKMAPQATEPLAEGYREWEAGDPIEDIDMFGSIIQSPYIIPGVTTVQRVYGESPGSEPAKIPLDLDIYIDCSGSMPNPSINISYLSLCGTILGLSALRAGAHVQATLWSSAGVFETTGGFIRDEKRVLGTITGFVSGGTSFPLNVLRDTYVERKPADPPAHIVVISDEGCDTILANDEKGIAGEEICVQSLARAKGGGTLVLNIANPAAWPAKNKLEEIGFDIYSVQRWDDLVKFARSFVRNNYGGES